MLVLDTSLPGLKILQPKIHRDERGWFTEAFNAQTFAAAGLPATFAQDNQSFSVRGVLRGLHYQLVKPQGKLVRCLSGHVWDVAVDLRRDSAGFGKWEGFHLRPMNDEGAMQMLWIPEGFAHGFLVLSETAELHYKTTELYYPAGDRSIRWDDADLAIDWPLVELGAVEASVSAKDAAASSFRSAELETEE